MKAKSEVSWSLHYRVEEFRRKENDFALIIPVKNEGERFLTQLAKIRRANLDVDVIVVDYGSEDGATNPGTLSKNSVRALLTKQMPGALGVQLQIGFDYSLRESYLGTITMDGNGKDAVEGVARVQAALLDGCDFVQGSRFLSGGFEENTPLDRLFAIKLIHAPLVSVAAGVRFTDTTNGLRGYSPAMLKDERVKVFRSIFSSYELTDYLPIRAGRLKLKVREVPTARTYPAGTPPTKIHGVGVRFRLLVSLFRALLGTYNP